MQNCIWVWTFANPSLGVETKAFGCSLMFTLIAMAGKWAKWARKILWVAWLFNTQRSITKINQSCKCQSMFSSFQVSLFKGMLLYRLVDCLHSEVFWNLPHLCSDRGLHLRQWSARSLVRLPGAVDVFSCLVSTSLGWKLKNPSLVPNIYPEHYSAILVIINDLW